MSKYKGKYKGPGPIDFWKRFDDAVDITAQRVEDLTSGIYKKRTFENHRHRKKYPHLDQAVLLARLIGATVEYLVDGTLEEYVPSYLVDLLNDLRCLNKDQVEAVQRLVGPWAEAYRKRGVSWEKENTEDGEKDS